MHLSNTCRLIREKGYSAVLGECDKDRSKGLEANLPEERVWKFRQWVSLSVENRLEAIMAKTPIPKDFDLLSIDIESCDWQVWQSILEFSPKVVCIEFNPTIPNAVSFVPAADFSVKHGCSALALKELADEKGYVLAATVTNLIFVKAELADAVLGPDRPTLQDIRDEAHVTYVFSG